MRFLYCSLSNIANKIVTCHNGIFNAWTELSVPLKLKKNCGLDLQLPELLSLLLGLFLSPPLHLLLLKLSGQFQVWPRASCIDK